MNAVLENAEAVASLSLWPGGRLLLGLIVHVGNSPEGIIALLTLGIDKARA